MSATMLAHHAPHSPFAKGLHAYADLFRPDFRRRDQAAWAGAYLHGLLLDAGRKNIESIARRVPVPAGLAVVDPVQALQNFINQSPWDERKLLRRYRALLSDRWGDPGGVFVVGDVAIPKQGRRSVGVQRQYSREHGRKINCQVAVGVSYVTPAADYPLALRLYLPNGWLQTPERLDAAGVPSEFRTPAGKGKIALDLLDEVWAEGHPGAEVVAGPGYEGRDDLRDGLAERGRVVLAGEDAPGGVRRRSLETAERGWRLLKERLGLDHFEGRSWRGFHHHAALVLLAHGFLRTHDGGD
jgi:SRSO17 transposase